MRLTSVRHWSDTLVSDQYLIDVDPRVFEIWVLTIQCIYNSCPCCTFGDRANLCLYRNPRPLNESTLWSSQWINNNDANSCGWCQYSIAYCLLHIWLPQIHTHNDDVGWLVHIRSTPWLCIECFYFSPENVFFLICTILRYIPLVCIKSFCRWFLQA